MRRTSWKQPVIILIAFIIGLIVNLAARQILPGILPEDGEGDRPDRGHPADPGGSRDHFYYRQGFSQRGGLRE